MAVGLHVQGWAALAGVLARMLMLVVCMCAADIRARKESKPAAAV